MSSHHVSQHLLFSPFSLPSSLRWNPSACKQWLSVPSSTFWVLLPFPLRLLCFNGMLWWTVLHSMKKWAGCECYALTRMKTSQKFENCTMPKCVNNPQRTPFSVPTMCLKKTNQNRWLSHVIEKKIKFSPGGIHHWAPGHASHPPFQVHSGAAAFWSRRFTWWELGTGYLHCQLLQTAVERC